MTRCTSRTAALFLLCSLALPAWGQQFFLYEPKPVKAEEKDRTKDGVLVTEVSVKKGDTLKEISRKFSGRASYFPQILLFNKIKNPDRIYPGDIFRVPVTPDGVGADAGPVKVSAGESKKHIRRKRSAGYRINGAVTAGKAGFVTTSPGDAIAGQKLFERAIKAYKQDDFGTALALFDRYLASYPNSPLSADASLYKAECYLKLSSR